MNQNENTRQSEAEETFETLRNRIRDRFEKLSPHLQRIGRKALDQPNFIALNTIAVISEQVEVQPSTMIRFSKEFGYDGFSDLQRVFRHRLIEGAPVYREQVYSEHHADSQPIDMTATLHSCIDAQIATLEQVRRDVVVEDLARAVDLILGARHIYIAGQRRSRPIATYLAYGLTRLELHCTLLDFGGGMAGQQVANMDPQDLLIAIAFTPHSALVVDLARDAGYRGRSAIAITDYTGSPLARNAQISFFTDHDVSGQFRPISGSIGLVQAIVEGIGDRGF